MALPTFEQLLQAYESTGSPLQAVVGGATQGIDQGIALKQALAKKKADAAKQQAMIADIISKIQLRTAQENKINTPKPNQSVSRYNPKTGKLETIGEIPANGKILPPSTGFENYAQVRQKGDITRLLPSRTSPTSVTGAAATIQLAARQGKALIARPGTPQQIALASSDLARAVQRSAPQVETLRGSSYANNIFTKLSKLSQQITADPASADVPKLRKQIYNVLDDLEKSSRPFVERGLSDIEDIYKDGLPKDWDKIKKRELGENIPNIEFQETESPKGVTTAEDFLAKYK